MAGEAASALGLSMAVWPNIPATPPVAWRPRSCWAPPSWPGTSGPSPTRYDVVTFDHEQVDLDLVAALDRRRRGPSRRRDIGAGRRQGPHADRARRGGVPVPPTWWWTRAGRNRRRGGLCRRPRLAVMVKAARGGYDGRCLARGRRTEAAASWPASRPDRGGGAAPAAGRAGGHGGPSSSGAAAAWPAVETAQVGGVCREVLVPGRIEADVLEAASALGEGGGDRRRRRRHGRRALLVGWQAAGQRSGDPAPQLWPLDDGGSGDLPVREPPAGRLGPAARVHRAAAYPGRERQRLRWPGRRRSADLLPGAWPSRAPMSTSMARGPARTQTGPRDGLWGRRRGGALAGLVGRHRARHAGARRRRPAAGLHR